MYKRQPAGACKRPAAATAKVAVASPSEASTDAVSSLAVSPDVSPADLLLPSDSPVLSEIPEYDPVLEYVIPGMKLDKETIRVVGKRVHSIIWHKERNKLEKQGYTRKQTQTSEKLKTQMRLVAAEGLRRWKRLVGVGFVA